MSGRGGLTVGQDRFVAELLKDHNATAAYKRAYPKVKSDGAARACSSRLLTYANVRSAVEAAMSEQQERLKITADDVVAGLHREATYTGDGSSQAARVSAWAWLGKHLAMFVERQRVEGSVEVEVTERVVRTREEARQALSAMGAAGGVPGRNGHSERLRGGPGLGQEPGGGV